MLGKLRSTVAPLKRALARPLARTGIPPNLLSALALPLAGGAAALTAAGRPGLALLLALPALLVDFVDGEVARLQGTVSPFGNCLEAVVDRAVEALLLVGLAAGHGAAAAAALGSSHLVSYVKARTGLVVEADNSDWPGWADHGDRSVALAGLLAWMACGASPGQVEGALWALASFSLVGALQRLRHAEGVIARGRLLPYLRKEERCD